MVTLNLYVYVAVRVISLIFNTLQANTLIDNHGNALLCDFGLATIVDEVPSGLTTPNKDACTARYASPELIMGGIRTLECDVWAWGCLLLEVSHS